MPAPRRMRLTTKLVAAILALLAVVLLAFSAATLGLTARDLSQRLDGQVQQAAQRSLAFARHGGDERGPDAGHDPMQAPGQGAGVLTVVSVAGQVTSARWQDDDGDIDDLTADDVKALATAGALSAEDATTSAPGSPDRPGAMRTVRLSIGEYRVATRQTGGRVADSPTLIVTGLPTASVRGPVTRLAVVEGLGILLALALAGTLASLVIRRNLRPLEQVSAVAARVGALPLDTPTATLPADRVPAALAAPGTEVGDVGSALNHLLDNVGTALVARQRSEQSLREFVADASHELRTPLAAVRGYADLVRLTEPLTPDGRDALTRVDSQAQRMSALVDDLLLLARLDAGQVSEPRPVDVNELAVEAVLDAQAAGRDHTWALDVPDEPTIISGDQRQLAQVLANLLSNARKHTPSGSRVATAVRHDGAAAVITVTDDGPGIPPEFVGRIFDRFARADTQRAASREGSTGLGLSIVAAIVQRHGGTVGVDSVPGRTTFTVRLPLAQSLST